jgi:RNA polymerase sigma factor (sigma-70 family)
VLNLYRYFAENIILAFCNRAEGTHGRARITRNARRAWRPDGRDDGGQPSCLRPALRGDIGAYLTVWRKSGQYRFDRGAPLAWMTTIARNKAIDRLRADVGRARDLEDWDERTERRISQIAVRDEVPKHLSDTVRRCIESLQDNYRKSLLRAYYYGMSHEELADVMDSPLGTVKSWVRRGLLQLKECVDQ